MGGRQPYLAIFFPKNYMNEKAFQSKTNCPLVGRDRAGKEGGSPSELFCTDLEGGMGWARGWGGGGGS